MIEIHKDNIPKWLQDAKMIDILFQDENTISIEERFYKENASFSNLKELENLISIADYWELEIKDNLFNNIISFLKEDEYNYYIMLAFLSTSDKDTGFSNLKKRIVNEIEGHELKIDCNLNILFSPIYKNGLEYNFQYQIILTIEHKKSKITYEYNRSIDNSTKFEKEINGLLTASNMLKNYKEIKEKFKKCWKYENKQELLFNNGKIKYEEFTNNTINYRQEVLSNFKDINYENKKLTTIIFSPYFDEENEIIADELVLLLDDNNTWNFIIINNADDYSSINSNFEIPIENTNELSKRFLEIHEKLYKEFNNEVEERKNLKEKSEYELRIVRKTRNRESLNNNDDW